MRVRTALLAAASLAALTGCKVFDRWSKPRDRAPSGEPASRVKDRDADPDRPPRHWLDSPAAPAGPDRPAPAPRPITEAGNTRSDEKGYLAGQVVDPDGRGVAYLTIQIDVTDAVEAGRGAPIDAAETDKTGYFLIRGLKPDRAYTLTAKTRQGGRPLSGQTVARTPGRNVRVQLREDLAITPPPAAGGGVLPYPGENRPADGAYSPALPPNNRPATPSIPPPASPKPPAPGRPDLTTNIPGPGEKKEKEKEKDGDLLPPPMISKFRPTGGFSLIDADGRERTFPGRAGKLVLLDFMTTTCGPCKRAVPALKEIRSAYAADGLEVVAVACDDADESGRRSAAKRYAEDYALPYPVTVEPGSGPGRVMKRFGVNSFPTLVLLDARGAVVWQGRPSDRDALERAIRAAAK